MFSKLKKLLSNLGNEDFGLVAKGHAEHQGVTYFNRLKNIYLGGADDLINLFHINIFQNHKYKNFIPSVLIDGYVRDTLIAKRRITEPHFVEKSNGIDIGDDFIEFDDYNIDGLIFRIVSVSYDAILASYLFENNYVSKLKRLTQQAIYEDEFGDLDFTESEKIIKKFVNKKYNDINLNMLLAFDEIKEKLPFQCSKYCIEIIDYQIQNTDLLNDKISAIVDDYEHEVSSYQKPEIFDSANPYEYEQLICNEFIALGWEGAVTSGSGDQGADVILEKNGFKMVVQCKQYSQPVGNKAVQEIFSAKTFYSADIAIVVTNNSYTKSARQLADSLDVELIHHEEIKFLDSKIFELDEIDSN